jgi:uncharacterized protein YfaS (alpha-2-macroglobulin family)
MPSTIATGWAGLAAALSLAVAAQGATIVAATPRGEVAQVRQVTVKFSEAVVAFGDPRLADPMTVSCRGAVPPGSGRWANDRVWLYDFKEDLAPGTRCTLALRAEWKPLNGAITGSTSFSFATGGPAVTSIQPYPDSEIEEDQHFLLRLSGAAVESTVSASAWCEVEGIGERLALRLVGGAARDALLKARRIAGPQAARVLVATCARPLPNGAKMRVVWGAGIAAAANPVVVTSAVQRWRYTVRPAFTAEFTCERERANAPCLPIRPMALRFSAPVARELASQVRLRPETGAPIAPAFDPDDRSSEVTEVAFPKPLPERTAFTIELPPGVKDNAGRALSNASSFPLRVATGDAPPIAKFAAAPFGIVERLGDALLPVTLRHVQPDLRAPGTPGASGGGKVRVKTLTHDEDILAWYAKLKRYHEAELSAQQLGLPRSEWTTVEEDTDARGRKVRHTVERRVETRRVALLEREPGVRTLELPQLLGGDPRPFEVVGLPLPQPGFYVVEIESRVLGEALLDAKAPMYVRTGALVTNLGVHVKVGRENAVAWVTSLDRGQPVAGADVAVRDCRGTLLWQGRTDASGLAVVARSLDPGSPAPCPADDGLFVSARATDAAGVADVAFVFTSWQKGIEPWRFNVPTGNGRAPELRAHTIFDRTLLRAGETVSMKHLARIETSSGLLAVRPEALPTRLKIVHEGSGQEFVQPLVWAGNRAAVSTWNIPPAAKLGVYRVSLERDGGRDETTSWVTGDFRVEEFRVPLVDAKVSGPKGPVIAPHTLPVDVLLQYFSGGGMAQAALRGSALLKPRTLFFPGYDEFSFQPPRRADAHAASADEEDDEDANAREGRLVADKVPLITDRNGAAQLVVKELPSVTRPSQVEAEITFNDPDGEVQTAATTVDLWPSAVVLGVKTGAWASGRGQVKFQALALDTSGKPLQGQAIEVRGRLSQTISTRKRMVGGFYAYDNKTETKDLGPLCSGATDDRGLLLCEATLENAGQVELVARAQDAQGHGAEAAASVWITRQGELWFAQDNDDRIDVLPEKKKLEPGETARLQVRMPYREARVLLSVEREGVMELRVLTLRGDDPVIELPIKAAWAPNVYVSVLALRGRIRETPWYSFFTWGWKEPGEWARSFWYDGREYRAPTAMVDLAKPSFKLGVAALQVGRASHELKVEVAADRPQYAVRQKAVARIRVTQGGQPVPGAELAFAAVDEGLLALRPNASWDLLSAMIRERAWGVETSTAQSEIIGRRHYGRKAVAAGGGGGRDSTRELFDTLLVWKARVPVDANGEARIEVPLNDSLTSFRLVAVADAGLATFGTGATSIKVTQDLQLLAGLPPLVREGDRYTALLTLRNTTARDMTVRATLQGTAQAAPAGAADIVRTPIVLAPQDVALPAGAAREITWPVNVPAEAFSITWEGGAEEARANAVSAPASPALAGDRLKVTQLVASAVPVRVLQTTLQQLDGPVSLPVATPADALPASAPRGGLAVAVQPRLSGALPGLRRFFETYPFTCLEQKTSKSVGLKDAKLWAAVANTLPTYLDADGLASYFPPRAEDGAHGSDRLTAYVLAATHEAGFELPGPARDAMLAGLTAFVEGRIERRFWSPRADLDVRKIAAIEALSRYGRATPRMLGSVNVTPNTWPTAAVIDWLSILRRVPGISEQASRRQEANQILRARLTYAGTTLKFSTEDGDFWWWLMDSGDANAARLILAVLDDPAWRDDLPRLVVGHLARQKRGAWLTTTANLWGSLALDKFAARYESVRIAGRTVATLSPAELAASAVRLPVAIDWTRQPEGASVRLAWPAGPATLQVAQDGSGRPWLSVQSLAAVPLKAPLAAGYAIARSTSAVEQKDPTRWSRGDVVRVHLEIDAQSDMTWVVVSDPVPTGATILGSGLGRDSAQATRTEKQPGRAWPAYEERSFEAFRSYFEFLPKGRNIVEYTLRLNNPGSFSLPPTRVEALYAPETFGELPNATVEVGP